MLKGKMSNDIISIFGLSKKVDPGMVEGVTYCCNDFFNFYDGIDIAFQIHHFLPVSKGWRNWENWIEEYKQKAKFCVVHPEWRKFFKTAEYYPFDKVFDVFNHRALNNSISFMLAYAILQQPAKINLFNCPMATNTEYVYQVSSVCYFVQFAKKVGIFVNADQKYFKPYKLKDLNGKFYHQSMPRGKVLIASSMPTYQTN